MARLKVTRMSAKRQARTSVQTALPVTEARKRSNLTEAVALKLARAEVKSHRQRSASRDAIVETLDVMSHPDAAEALRGSFADIEASRVHSLDEVARRLQLRRESPRRRK